MNSNFYCNIGDKEAHKKLIELLENYSQENNKQIYIIDKPQGAKKFDYDYKDALILLIPKTNIIILNLNHSKKQEFLDYCEDILEDVGYLSDKYDYKQVIGRPRKWRNYFKFIENDLNRINIISEITLNTVKDESDSRSIELIISLLTGSINDIDRIGNELPQDLLDIVKKKIILFDGDQTNFIYKDKNKKQISIQGLAGTGKTELLLHKLKELYISGNSSKIVITCFNKILANTLRDRIPVFFNFMKVEEQIKWNDRLYVMHSWGSKGQKLSGIYSYICSHYDIPFYPYSFNRKLDSVCKNAIIDLDKIKNFEPCFDYILIDESQDFPKEFFELCNKVTRTKIYIAGDIFQNVFGDISSKVEPDYLLNKCYRTDPKTLMFAHCVSMGLLEQSKLRWLSDDEWKACGYQHEKKGSKYILSRNPIRRFEDIQKYKVKSTNLIVDSPDNYISQILKIIEELNSSYPSIKPDDIGIVFLENSDDNYKFATALSYKIYNKFNYYSNIGYETKEKSSGSIFISNRNNIKGLEFPFIICVCRYKFNRNYILRNSIYMMLTRSFITSYLLITNDNDKELIDRYSKALLEINEKNCVTIQEPSESEKQEINKELISQINLNKTQEDIINEIIAKMNMEEQLKDKITQQTKDIINDNMDEIKIEKVIKSLYNINKELE